MTVISASMAAFLVSTSLLLALRPLAAALGLIDRPGGRKKHDGDVPVIGGIAMFAGLVIAAAGGEQIGHRGLMLLAVAAFMVLLGALDDRFNLPPKVRLFAHVSAAVALVYGTGYSVPSLGNLFGSGSVSLGLLALPFTVVATVALINAFNMLDGLDGLAGSAGLVAFGAILVIAEAHGFAGASLVAGGMVGALLSFLLFNMPVHINRSIRTFMGDAGSTLLGFVLAGVSLGLIQPSGPALKPVIILWLMPIPIFELFTSTFRRLVKGLPPTQADAGHFHHVLREAGYSVRAICALYLVASLLSACVGVYAASGELSEPLLFLGFALMFLCWLWFIVNARNLLALMPAWVRRERRRAF